MAKSSAKQIANQERFKRIGWQMSRKRGGEYNFGAVLPTDFDPPTPSYLRDEDLRALFIPSKD